MLLTEVSADHHLAVLANARGEALQGHADSVAFRVPQVVVIDTIPLLHHTSAPAQQDKRRWALVSMELTVPTTPELRNHQKIHDRKADQAGQKTLLHKTAHQPPRIKLADHQLSSPKNRHLHSKRNEGETPFRWAETEHNQLLKSPPTIGRSAPESNKNLKKPKR